MKNNKAPIDYLPPIISRSKINYLTGGLITKKHIQNLDSEGKGPKQIKCGKRVGYLREDFVTWFIA